MKSTGDTYLLRKNTVDSEIKSDLTLRTELFDKVVAILNSCDRLQDSRVRTLIQSSCLEIVVALEEVMVPNNLEH